VKFGAQYEYVGPKSTAQDNANGTCVFRSDLPFNAADPRTYPERLSIRVPGPLDRYQKARYRAAFAQGKWRLNDRATLSLGLRYDVEIQPLELISAILMGGVFSDSFTQSFPANNADPGPSLGNMPTDPMLVGGPTVNRTLLNRQYPAGSRIRNTGNVTLDNADRVIPYTDQLTAGRNLFRCRSERV
jgi:hypothetical protein